MAVIQAHYPERSDKLFIVNAPFWFAATWRVISPWIDPRTREKISILGGGYKAELRSYIGAANLPEALGGDDPTPMGQSTIELDMRAYAQAVLDGKADGGTKSPAAPPPGAPATSQRAIAERAKYTPGTPMCVDANLLAATSAHGRSGEQNGLQNGVHQDRPMDDESDTDYESLSEVDEDDWEEAGHAHPALGLARGLVRGAAREVYPLRNADGSVNRAWPVEAKSGKVQLKCRI